MKKYLLLVIISILILSYACNQNEKGVVSVKQIKTAELVFGLEFTNAERDSLKDGLGHQIEDLNAIQEFDIENAVSPVVLFNPRPIGYIFEKEQEQVSWDLPDEIELPEVKSQIAFMPVAQLSGLIRERKITSLELTKIYLERLKKYGDTLECVITITEKTAIEQAMKADREIAAGNYRGPLHGIPYGVKDLLAVKGYKTTWGAGPFKEQIIDGTATVVNKLNDAGAVLIAKLTMGALAMGDVWYGGVTKNPWDLNQGSSGSSAGSASATSAGLVAFSIGTETWGSIVSPSTRCGVTGLRPTFGRVSRAGAMALSWTMDKIGPICRSAEDAAIVFDVIRGKDGIDQTVVDMPFNYQSDIDYKDLRIGYLEDLFNQKYRGKSNDSITLELIKKLGAELQPVKLPDNIPVQSLAIILEAEAAAAFNALTISNKDDLLKAQHKYAWPNIFRRARLIPAVEYIQANRIRRLLMEELNKLMGKYDVIISPSFGGNQLLMTNLTGHPCVVVPNGFDEENHPTSISFIGNLYDEASILSFAKKYQENSNFDEKHPQLFMD